MTIKSINNEIRKVEKEASERYNTDGGDNVYWELITKIKTLKEVKELIEKSKCYCEMCAFSQDCVERLVKENEILGEENNDRI